jgi:hypothetical protein
VLPESQLALLQSACGSLEASASVRLLLTGGAGTGKTMACQILGAAVEAPVFSLEASGKASLETETVEEVLRAAGRVSAIVVFDHADVLLRGRADSRKGADTLSGGALLARVRDHGGAVVFTATATRGIKDELLGELDAVVDFPFPDRDARAEIWRRLLPHDARLTDEDFAYLAASFQLAGAAIRTCCTAAILAAEAEAMPVSLAHVTEALELEYHDRLVGPATLSALTELRRRSGIEVGDEAATAVLPAAVPAQRRRWPTFGLRRHRAASERRNGPRRFRPLRPPRLPGRRPVLGFTREAAAALALVATILAAGLGFLAGKATGGGGRSFAHPSRASIGLGTISIPTAWHRHAPPANLGIASEVAVSPARAGERMLVIGSANTGAPTFLPAALLAASLPAVPTPQVVRVGPLQFYRYQILAAPGQTRAESVYVLPTTDGTVVADCLAGVLNDGFDSSCQGVLATLRLSTASALSLTPSATYTSDLDHALLPLNLARQARSRQLNTARSRLGVARAARALANAHATAAAKLRTVDAGVASAPNAALVTALTQTADAYRALARAALRGNRRGYQRAQAALARANSDLATAYAQLQSLGYRVS